MKDSQRKAMFAKKWDKLTPQQRMKMFEKARDWEAHAITAQRNFGNLERVHQDMLLKKAGFNINRTVKYPYKLKSKSDPRHPKEPELHYMERTGQILSSRKWSGTKKHMVHHATGQDYHGE